MDLIRRCVKPDGTVAYTLSESCPAGFTNPSSVVARPPRYSIVDKYAQYRRDTRFPKTA